MKEELHILIIDDEPRDYQSFRERYVQHQIKMVGDPDMGINLLGRKEGWDAVLVDLDLGKGFQEGIEVVVPRVVKQVNGKYPVIVVTKDIRPSVPRTVLRHGVRGFMQKGSMNDESLMDLIQKTIQKQLRPPSDKRASDRVTTSPIVSTSPTIAALQKRWLTLVHYLDKPVLLLGETGTGKDLAARYIYEARANATLPYEVVNLKAFSENLVPSELFGHVKGAFTGADKDKVGYLEKVGEGTLFIDEIGEIPESIQVQLLRVIENRTFQRVGDTETRTLKAQLIFATNKDLREAIANGNMREDFYQRISTLSFTIPPLRERTEDIIPLINHFLRIQCHLDHPLYVKDAQAAFTPAALQRLLDYRWPANIRELRNEIERLVFEADVQQVGQIDTDLLAGRFSNLQAVFPPTNPKQTPVGESPAQASDSNWPLKKIAAYEELKRIEQALIAEGGRKLEAAHRLGLKNDQYLRYRVEKKFFKNFPELFEEFRTITKAYGLCIKT